MKDDALPTRDEILEIMRHPITQKLNREFRECLEQRQRDPDYDPPIYRGPHVASKDSDHR